MKYLDTELATATITDATIEFMHSKGVELINGLLASNFQRIFINVHDAAEFAKIYDMIKNHENVFIYSDDIAHKNQQRCIIRIPVNELPIREYHTPCFYQIDYSEQLISILQKHKRLFNKVIISVPDDMLSADKIFNDNKLPNTELMFSDFLITTQTIKQHPCNIFLCSGLKCHGRKSSLPRNLFITATGEVYVHKLPNLVIGNINDNDIDIILSKYIDSIEHKKFIALNRKLYIRYVLPGLLTTLFTDNCLKRISDEII